MNLQEWRDTGDRFKWRGQEVFYQEAGDGEVIFLLHGFLTSSWIYKYLWPTLTQHYRVIAPDYMGCGFSSKPKDYKYGMDERVDMIYALADLLDVKNCHVLAASYSVSIVQELLHRQLKGSPILKIRSAVFLNGVIFSDKSIISFRQRLLLTPLVGRIIARVFGERTFKNAIKRRVGKSSEFPEDLLGELFHQFWNDGGIKLLHATNQYLLERASRKKYLEAAMRETDVPIQLIWGIDKGDQIAGIKLVNEYRKIRGDQYVVMLKGVGHFPMVEQPEIVLQYYMSFLDGLKAVDAGISDDGSLPEA